ncbi:MAG: SDR family oxidoreductase [Bacteroidia bacterium]|nr:SDR family oxidoreductase [Bacteroidia bacterium]
MSSLSNKVIIITGASSGIGEACALHLASHQCKLVLAARSIDKLKAVAQACKAKGAEVITVSCDVAKEEDCKQLVEESIRAFGTIHVLLNNAGISMRAVFEQTDLQVIRQVMDINFWGTVYCTKYALPYILKEKGSVVGVSSIAGYKGLPGRTGYSASKFAMQGFLEALRTENMKKGLHVLIACPGYTASNIRNTALNNVGKSQSETPLDESKLMQPEEVAAYIIQAVIKRKRTLILTTQGKLAVWLNKFFPAFTDRMVYKTISKEPDSPFK